MSPLSGADKSLSADLFQPFQIVYLENQQTRLYAEVVQIAEMRQICWARPLLLVETIEEGWLSFESIIQPCLYDLRESSDLLLPIALFQGALDTEIIPLLTALMSPGDANTQIQPASYHQLNRFIQQLCSDHPEAFGDVF